MKQLTFTSIILKTTLVHAVTYFVVCLIAFTF